MAARLLGALVFFALIGLAVSPALFDRDGSVVPERPAESPALTPSEEPTAEPEPTEEPTAEVSEFRFTDPYPKACLRPVSRPGPFGHVAAFRDGAITIATTSGDVQATIRSPGTKPPLAWSPSGTILATGPQGLFWRPNGNEVLIGDVQHGLVQGRRGTWGWSPVSDCGVHIDEAGALIVAAANPHVVGPGRLLIDEGVESFSYSPDGRKLALLLEEGWKHTLWVADLTTDRVALVKRFGWSGTDSSLAGWTPSGDGVLFRSRSWDRFMLRSVTVSGESTRWGLNFPGAQLALCGEALIGAVGRNRSGNGGRLAELVADGPERFLTDDLVPSFSCSPDSRFLVVQTEAGLALLGRDGSFIRQLTNIDTGNGQWGESNPEWGPPRTGILFVRGMHLQSQLWFIPEGGRAEQPVMDLELSGKWAQSSLYDWSATPPDGLPSG